ncbi:hypothetical protein E8E13_007244 [Curvularia kusanoi]|uniref:Uncharacterized protein n=1 Tax=Curvularia kusanoi TaxID=90978 RepID=A0A9P4TI71_CURKU|nr:hypothetical protein E8E13_007244 [Curvularia kusanoi]
MSRRLYNGTSTRASSGSANGDEDVVEERSLRRPANVYDAIAGRVTQAGLVGNIKDVKSSRQPLRPDEVLFKQANAPIRYEETDYYNAHARLPANQQLPSSELLTAIHAYVSKLYSRNTEGDSLPAWKCMDETALIALGILMEESAREVLGETGDFAFVEAADDEEEKILDSQSGNAPADAETSGSEQMSRAASIASDSDSTSDGSRYSSEESD